MSTNPKPVGRPSAVAACAAALAASVGLVATPDLAAGRTLDQVQRYCVTSWRNAGIHPQDWQDCTQEAIVELLERVPQHRLDAALADGETPERRELKRAVWRTIQRWRRAPRPGSIDGMQLPDARDGIAACDLHEAIDAALGDLSTREQRILTLWSQGHSIDEIAGQLGMTPPQASDQKYKALQKLKARLAYL